MSEKFDLGCVKESPKARRFRISNLMYFILFVLIQIVIYLIY